MAKENYYRSLHKAVQEMFGKADECKLCNGEKGCTSFEWLNKDHKYKLLRKDWWKLCISCHREWDIKHNNYKQDENNKIKS